MSRLWDKGDPLDKRVLAFTAGEDHVLDNRLVAYDVRASIAHADMLAAQGLLTEARREEIADGLTALGKEHAAGEWTIGVEEEDVHTALESRLTDRAPDAGPHLHLGRSRNDQVLAALRLYLKDVCQQLAKQAQTAADGLEALALREKDTPLPGYTHLQQAMPSSVALWAGGFAAELLDDAAGMDAAVRRADRNPLGSAAGYGAPALPLQQPLGLELAPGPGDGVVVDADLGGQSAHRGGGITGAQQAACDGAAHAIGDLAVERDGGVGLDGDSHYCSIAIEQ